MKATIAFALLAAIASPLAAQDQSDSIPTFQQRSLDGPRMGFTYMAYIKPGSDADREFTDRGLDHLMSLFGWHVEQIIRPQQGGPMFVIQEVAMVAGVDQGLFIPSGSVLFGIRFPSGLEFGMGPNMTPLGPAMAVGIGKSLRYGGVSLPFNIAIVRSKDALRTTFAFGYAIRRS
jgi:hypothetical protein